MLNLIRMNTYRILHTKCMLVVFLFMLLMSGLSTYMTVHFSTYTTVHVEKIEEQVQQEAQDNGSTAVKIEGKDANEAMQSDFGLAVNEPPKGDWKMPTFLSYFCTEIQSGLLLIFFTIAASLFIHAEDKTGFVKNIAGQTRHKYDIYLAKIVSLCFYFLGSMICYGLVRFCMMKYYCGSEFKFGIDQLNRAVLVLGVQLLLHLVFMNGLAMLLTICKSTAVAITVGILSACGFGSIFTDALDQVFHIKIDPWLVYHNIKLVGIDTRPADLLHALSVGMLFFILYNLIGTVWFVKKDVV